MKTRVKQGLVGIGVSLALLAVLSMYLQPDFFVTMANQVWSCF